MIIGYNSLKWITKGVREQLNQASAYIDLSNVYSTTEKDEHGLRDIDGGYMKSPTEPDGRYMLLRSKDPNDGCNRPEMVEANTPCFRSGLIQKFNFEKWGRWIM